MSPWIKLPLLLIAILIIVGLFYVVLRRMTGARLMPGGSDQGRNRQPRLGVVDVYDLDRTRQLVLLRRDNVEHLLLLGGPNDVVIETNIVRVTAGKLSVTAGMKLEQRPEATAFDLAPAPELDQPVRPVIESTVTLPPPEKQPVMAATFSQTAYAPHSAGPTASQTIVSAASFAAVAAATQPEHASPEVPQFLRTPYGNHGAFGAPVGGPAEPPRPNPEPESPMKAPAATMAEPFQATRRPMEPSFLVLPPGAPAREAPIEANTTQAVAAHDGNAQNASVSQQAQPAPARDSSFSDMARKLKEALASNPPTAAAEEHPTEHTASATPPQAPMPPPGEVAEASEKKNDPFAMDNIEAEFARLLGRSSDKPNS